MIAMRLVDPMIAELEQEAETTRRVLERIPEDRLGWRPHPRSISLRQLALHIATIPGRMAQVAAADSMERPQFERQLQPQGIEGDRDLDRLQRPLLPGLEGRATGGMSGTRRLATLTEPNHAFSRDLSGVRAGDPQAKPEMLLRAWNRVLGHPQAERISRTGGLMASEMPLPKPPMDTARFSA